MFAFVIKENTNYPWGLSCLGRLETYFACTLVGDLDAVCEKGSGMIVVGLCPVDYMREDVEKQVRLSGYEVISISLDELVEWAYTKETGLGNTISRIATEMLTGGWDEKNQEALVFHVKHFAQSKDFFKK